MKWSNQQKGIAFALLAPLLYALKSISIKSTPPIKAEQIVFLRYFFDFLILSPFFFKAGKTLVSKKVPLHLMRATFIVLSACCSVYGIKHLALVDALLLENTMPLFIPFVLWIWHRQKITLFSCIILLLGFSSVFLLLKSKLDILHIASFASLSTGFLSAITTVSIKTLSKTESPISILFYFNIFAGSLAFIFCVYTWDGMPVISFSYWLPIIMNSLFGILFQYTIIRAYSLISPHVVGCFAYFGILFSALFGWVIWQESLDQLQIIGGSFLVGSGLLMILENNQKAFSIEGSMYRKASILMGSRKKQPHNRKQEAQDPLSAAIKEDSTQSQLEKASDINSQNPS
jgi:drug/metabolite transporter (DMT)-like permease